MIDVIHVITPGDHYSPRTGSAIPTVVHGLASASARAGDPTRHAVVIERTTMRPRYDSATVIEYDGAPRPGRREKMLDLVRGRLGRPRAAVGRYYEPIAGAVRGQPPGIVIAHNAPVLPWLLRDSPHRVVLYAHNDLLRTYSRGEAGRMLDGVAAIVCVSDSLAEQTLAALPRRFADRVRVVANGVDCTRFAPAGRPDAPGALERDRRLRVMFVGRMIAEKGPDVLVRAAGRIGRPDLEFVLVGSHGFARDAPLSPYEQELRRLADGSDADVRFEPFVDRMALPELLRTADILVVPSRWAEPSGLTASEGLATGLPVIASRVGGLPGVVGDVGVLVSSDDPDALASAIQALADDPAERARRAAASREYALAHDWAWAWVQLRGVLDGL